MFDNIEYSNCPLCFSKDIKEKPSPDGSRILIICGNEDCGNKIGSRPVSSDEGGSK